jgi:hypothetical protein
MMVIPAGQFSVGAPANAVDDEHIQRSSVRFQLDVILFEMMPTHVIRLRPHVPSHLRTFVSSSNIP